jgi:branched-chain amino acid transport system permease protein
MVFEQVINIFISGLRLSVIYCLMALGFTIVYGVGKVFNYAHGAFFTWGAYIAWFLSAGFFHLNHRLAFLLTIPIMFLFGMAFERTVIYPLRRRPGWTFTVFIVTLGAALFLDSLALVCFGPRFKKLPPLVEGTLRLGDFVISKHDALLVIIVVLIVIILGLFLSKIREGMVMRAVSQDTLAAKMVGIPIDRVFSTTFGISAVLAGISGMLLTPRTLLYPVVGWPILFKAFVIVVFAGLGSIKGTLYAAFILGMIEAFVAFYIGGVWGLPVFLVILLVVLVFRPQGLFGTEG